MVVMGDGVIEDDQISGSGLGSCASVAADRMWMGGNLEDQRKINHHVTQYIEPNNPYQDRFH